MTLSPAFFISSDPMNNDTDDEITQTVPEDSLEGGEKVVEEDPLEKAQAQLKETQDKYLRTYADFENYRKRVSKEKEDLAFMTSERILREILDVKDHLELALAHSESSSKNPQANASAEMKTLKEGVTLTLRQMEKFLEQFGVKEAKALGEVFNPNYHEAIQQEESHEYKPGVVSRVYQKGYLLRDRLLRAARVVVASGKKS